MIEEELRTENDNEPHTCAHQPQPTGGSEFVMRATPILRDNLGFGTLSSLVFSPFSFQTILDVLPHFLSLRPEQKLPLSSPPSQ